MDAPNTPNPPLAIGLDTETGGLDERLTPLLSVAIVVAGEGFKKIDGFEIKVRPPRTTMLEIPSPPTWGLDNKAKKIVGWMNVWTKDVTTAKPDFGVPVITAYAAELNKYKGEGVSWEPKDIGANIDRWHDQAKEITQAETDIVAYLDGYFGKTAVTTLAHNVAFDRKFVLYSMPRLTRVLDPWFCTLDISRLYWKVRDEKHGSKLSEMAKVAGYEYGGKAHEAFADVEACLAVFRFISTQPEWTRVLDLYKKTVPQRQ